MKSEETLPRVASWSRLERVRLIWRRDAAQIVRIIVGAVKYLHDQGIVHRGEFLS